MSRAVNQGMLPPTRLDGSDEYEAMTTIAKSPSIAPPPRKSSRQVHASLEVSSSRNSVCPILFDSGNEPEDVTRLMPSPHAAAFPAPPRVPNDIVPTMRPLKNRVHLPNGQGTQPPSRTERPSMRPTAPPAPPSRPPSFNTSRPPTPPSMRPPPASMRPLGVQDSTRTALRPHSVPPPPPSSGMMGRPEDTFRPVTVNAASTLQILGQRPLDSRSDVPAMAHSTTEIVLKGRPTAPWAMALVAMGVFGGILTAVVTGGGGSSIIQAGATFVDPSRAASAQEMPKAAAAAAPIRVEEKIAAPVAAAPAAYYPPAVETAKTTAKVEAPKPEPVAAAKPVAPVVRSSWQPPARAAAPAPAPAPQPVAAAAPVVIKPVPAPVAEKPVKPAKAAKGQQAAADLESANQADELARQQLEQSLK